MMTKKYEILYRWIHRDRTVIEAIDEAHAEMEVKRLANLGGLSCEPMLEIIKVLEIE